MHRVIKGYQYSSGLPYIWTCNWPFWYFQSGNPGTVSNVIGDSFLLAQQISFSVVLNKNTLSAGRDPNGEPIISTKNGKRIIFLSCPTPNVCASSAMPASCFLRRVTLKGISQPIVKGKEEFSCPNELRG